MLPVREDKVVWFIILIVIVAVVLAAARQRSVRPKQPAEEQTFPYEKKKTLFSPAERSFLGVLDQAAGTELRVLAKVRLADVISSKKGAGKGAFNRISSKHVDFMLCDPKSAAPLCGIELDDSSHERASRRERDAFVDGAFRAAGLPLLRFPAKQTYALRELREALEPFLANTKPTAPTLPTLHATSPAYPSCGADVIQRKAAKGENAGQAFWGCSSYPRCRTTLPVNEAAA